METCVCDTLPKKSKRSFIEAWLSDERYKNWIRKVPSDNTCYYCSVCNKTFSCTSSHVSRHANSVRHQINLKRDISSPKEITIQNKFKEKWLDKDNYKLWLREHPWHTNLCYCTICDKSFTAYLSHIRRHAKSADHINLWKKKDVETSESNTGYNMQDNESLLSFDERKKSAEIKYAALLAEKNISYQTAEDILFFFQHIGKDPNVLKSMRMYRVT